MIGRLNHVAIATADLGGASRLYRESLGARVSEPVALPEHGVTVVFVEAANTKIELLQPLGADSPIAKFLEKNPDGGMHHSSCPHPKTAHGRPADRLLFPRPLSRADGE